MNDETKKVEIMDENTRKLWRDYAWGYFSQHAEQRLKAFNFYITSCAIVIGAFATIISRKSVSIEYAFLPLSLVFLSFIFWKLDVRTRMLIKHAEAALKYLDSQSLKGLPEEAKILALFQKDDEAKSKLKKYLLVGGLFTYGRVFNWVFVVMALAGVAGSVACVVAQPSVPADGSASASLQQPCRAG
ncbi:hypothetical protein [Pseudothauera rhizosphaerae]|uniref:Uncharacterized protein n=1 Tax=Pseudothauera rhizosphaerae TaxID=2565932 RepID=A0A4S4ALX5_9RHOO|nr:hypothetical protein [Pseudothauera rhizosphaerae]THF60455.1 hypothetical protein E6O51_13315 [Pseudothauera rhizosphaerae]